MTKIIKITKWYLNYGRCGPMLRRGQFVYGELVDENTWNIILSPRGERFLKRVNSAQNVDHPSHLNWGIIFGEDEWEVILEDQWPDEVCVALAKRALLGEDTTDAEE